MVSGTLLRVATEIEIARLQNLLEQDTNNSIRAVRNGSEVLGETVLAILHGGKYAGFCTFRAGGNEIFPLVVFGPFRGIGVGFSAMQQLIGMLREDGIRDVSIEVLPGAEAFWKKVFAGFPETAHFGGKNFTYAI
ncbi:MULTISPECIES: GNAT family N-acetyltransferase [Pseudomonas]|uniref:GNAT family N-acetyltransferase n=1 Tax=Pseudomonas TaxID=286 RepID=UPI001EF0ECEC|nr:MULTISPECIES: GNAT family N-acetyltransferase [Pseudomonas]MCF5691165.1 GNAT family N-acetyltransferase [Pseudomonas sp. PA-1-8C]MCF5789716.1 GNAT family N-acetyltransferase [Pseudomonas sp. PA-1-6G]MCF5791565.1 GNAT family N-acetyltransferase [Pseudomonas sp. PA-1-6B]MCF5797676.1 GNAT family N-acetyltransferase [Pseudomonas sp. PA-1-5A]MCF5814168.1 GNAT family N-acetyltransferase [Pseudomonas sp. PA-1-2A]